MEHEAGASHGHDHNHASVAAAMRAGSRFKKRLAVALAITSVVLVVQGVAGVLINSLALLSDAGHLLTDAVGLGMSLAAVHLADRPGTGEHRTFGLYRLEILAALANALLLFGVAAWVIFEAVQRFGEPPELAAVPILVVAIIGFVANLIAFALLKDGAKESMNIEGASLEVLADTVGSAGIIVGATIMWFTGWGWVDPVIGVAIGLWILPRTYRLASRALRILVQAAPAHVDLGLLSESLSEIDGVVDVHDLHVWTLTSEMEVATAHLMVGVGTDQHGVLDEARDLLHQRFGIDHATLQIEPDDHQGCHDVDW